MTNEELAEIRERAEMADGDYIASSPSDIPALLDYIDELRKQIIETSRVEWDSKPMGDNWIPVKKRLPEEGKQYLIYSALTKKFGVSNAAKTVLESPGGKFLITHYMPIPTPPKGDKAND